MSKLKVGLQLYSIRDNMQEDMAATLKKVKEMGYDYVEFAGYFGHSAKEVRAMLDDNGLQCISVHQGYEVFLQNPQENVDYLKTIGARYAAVPWMDKEKHKGYDVFENTIKEFHQVGQLLKDAGMTLLYHNHDFEFEKFEGKVLLDWLYESISPDLLQTEIDTCWVRYAGYNPSEYIMQYAGRSPVVHLKDFACDNINAGAVYALIDDSGKEIEKKDRAENHFKFQPVGYGMQDFPSILKACENAGVEYVIVEQDSSVDRTPMEAVQLSREYLKGMGL